MRARRWHARWLTSLLLAHAAFGGLCEAARPFTPASDADVLLVLPRPDRSSRYSALLHERATRDPAFAATVARRYLARARLERDPSFFGRAEVIVRPWIQRAAPPLELLLIQADIEQFRHDFAAALELLDRFIATEPGNAEALLTRASIHIVRGDLEAARPDCRAVASAGEIALGTICLAEVIGAAEPARGAKLIKVWLEREGVLGAEQRAWALAILADLSYRSGDAAGAAHALRTAITLAPHDEASRAALADVLIAADRPRDALRVLDIDRAGPGVLVQRARAQRRLGLQAELRETRNAIADLFATAARRGERVHLREEAQAALYVDGDPERALALARRNFTVQRESEDVRLLARAARASADASALAELSAWMRGTGHQDAWMAETMAGVEE